MSAPSLPSWAVQACLVGLVFACYYPAISAEFVNWDDQFTVGRLALLGATRGQQLVYILGGHFGGKAYYPVFHLSLALDHWLWGPGPLAFHLSNVALHAVNTLLLFWLLRRTLGRMGTGVADFALPAAALASALFAVHPVNVEPVAWVSGRKVVLALSFALLSLHAHASSERGVLWRSLSAACFALSCLSNAATTSLPLLVFAYDYCVFRLSIRVCALRSLPMVGIALATGLARSSVIVSQGAGKPFELRDVALSRLAGIWQETVSLVWPSGLCNLYPLPVPSEVWIRAAGTALGFVASVVGVSLWCRRSRAALLFIAWYWIGLLPTLVHHFARADRHLYFPGIGAFALTGLCLAQLTQQCRPRRPQRVLAALAVGAVLTTLGVASRRQCASWASPVSLWGRSVAVAPRNWRALSSLGEAYLSAGDYALAKAHFSKSLAIHPVDNHVAHYGMARLLAEQGNHAGAISQYRLALRDSPGFHEAFHGWGVALEKQGKRDEAIARYRDALRLYPDYPECRGNLGLALAAKGDLDGALKELFEAAALEPGNAATQLNLGKILADRGSADAAARHYHIALQIDPTLRQAHYNLAVLLGSQGQSAESVRHYRRAVALDPCHVPSLTNLALEEMRLGRPGEAVKLLRRALELAPENDNIRMALGLALSESGQAEAAVRHFQEFVARSPSNGEARSALADEFTSAGRYAEAIRCLRAGVEAGYGGAQLRRRLAWLLATCPDASLCNGREAAELARQACETEGETPETLDVLAAAHAACGRFAEAVQVARRAEEMALAHDRADLADPIGRRIDVYRSGQRYCLPTGGQGEGE